MPALELDDGRVHRRDGRHLRVPRGEASRSRRSSARTAEERAETRMWQRRVELQHHRAPLQRVPLRRGHRAVQAAHARAARGRRRIEGDRARQARLARRLIAGKTVHRRRPLHDRRHHPLLRARLRPRRRTGPRRRQQESRRVVHAHRRAGRARKAACTRTHPPPVSPADSACPKPRHRGADR